MKALGVNLNYSFNARRPAQASSSIVFLLRTLLIFSKVL